MVGQLDIQKKFAELREIYAANARRNALRALVFGLYGTGKTTILRTARKPVLLALFDQGGEKVLRPQIESGEVIVLDYSDDNPKNPTAYARWEKDFQNMCSNSMFDHIGTYAIDSFTTWFDALSNQIIKKKNRTNGIFEIQDWQVAKNIVIEMMKLIGKQACDFVLTAHMVHDRDEVTGEIISDLNAFKSLRPLLPILFDEKWITETKKVGPDKYNYQICLESAGRYKASSRLISLSNGAIKSTMPPDIKNILTLAGFDAGDKPTQKKDK